jgi:ABC-type lipoprotein release transport system permease subunit
MGTYIKLAWRNIWRNRSRTFLTLGVLFISVFLSIVMTSEEDGTYGKIIDNVIDLTGELQVQNNGYQENKSINQGMIVDSLLLSGVRKTEHISQVITHLESFALASFRDMTKGVLVIGVVPSGEEKFSGLKTKYQKQSGSHGAWLQDQDDGVLIGEKLAGYLQIKLNDTLVLISQGYHGASAAGLFPVRGTIRLPSVELESRMIYMSMRAAQNFYGAEDLVTSLLLKTDKSGNMSHLQEKLKQIIPEGTCLKSWEELQPEVVQMIHSKLAGGNFIKGIFYMILGFIIFSTMVMMIYERRKEFGIMVAIGMQKNSLSLVVFMETMMISFLGTFLGLAAGYGLVSYLHIHPIPLQGEMAKTVEQYGFEPFIFFSKSLWIFYRPPIIVFCLTVIVYLFPFLSIRKMEIIRAIRN